MMRVLFYLQCVLLIAQAVYVSNAIGQGLPNVIDVGLRSRVQDNFKGVTGSFHQKRGRANICADFNNDGFVDLYSGNPGDESFVMINQTKEPGAAPIFKQGPILLSGKLAWGAAAADYDEDGDIDLFISCGGNEGVAFDHLFRNMLIESGKLSFKNVTKTAGVPGPLGEDSAPVATASANAVWVDYDRDGDVDLWVNSNDPVTYHNILWQNQLRETGEATFIDVTTSAGLKPLKPMRTFHSSWSDFDHDGDMDLFENNFRGRNTYWKNQLIESGTATFVDQTASASQPGEDLGFAVNSFGSAAIDFNSDGFDDILCVYRLRNPPGPEPLLPYGNGHAVFINDGTGRFTNGASEFFRASWPALGGVMGFMVGDLNGDTFPELFLGNGGPNITQANTFLISDGSVDPFGFPGYFDGSAAIDFPAPKHKRAPRDYYPSYPHRTHGVTFVDTNLDGQLEIIANNGGMNVQQDEVQEPNRHFLLKWKSSNFFVARLIGNSTTVNRDGIGARLKLTVSTAGGPTRHIYRTVRAGTAFSAQNDIRAIHFALGDADTIHEMEITWTDGAVQTVTDSNLLVNKRRTFLYGS